MMQYRVIATGCCAALPVAGGIGYAASLKPVDRNFMITAARLDMTQAHEGQIAESQANSANVKDLGKKLVQDYSDSYGHIAHLAVLKGTRFDRQFAREEIAAQRRAINAFQTRGGTRPGCRP